MGRKFDIRRFASLALALLIAVAVVGPVCLTAASSAMAMPRPASNLCDSNPATACPYERPDANLAGAHFPTVNDAVVAWLPMLGADLPAQLVGAPQQVAGAATGPISYLTPLRI